MWRNENPCALLVGTHNGAAIMKNSVEVPQKIKDRITVWSSSPTYEYMPRRIEGRALKRSLYPHVLNSIVHNNQEVEADQASIEGWMGKQTVPWTHSGILFSLKKEGNLDTGYTMDEAWGHYAQWNKQTPKNKCCMITLVWGPWSSQVRRSRKQNSRCQGLGRRGTGSCRVWVLQDEKCAGGWPHALRTPPPAAAPRGHLCLRVPLPGWGSARGHCRTQVASTSPVVQDLPSVQAKQTPRPRGLCAGQTSVRVLPVSSVTRHRISTNSCTSLSLILYKIGQHDQIQTRAVDSKMPVCLMKESCTDLCACPAEGDGHNQTVSTGTPRSQHTQAPRSSLDPGTLRAGRRQPYRRRENWA